MTGQLIDLTCITHKRVLNVNNVGRCHQQWRCVSHARLSFRRKELRYKQELFTRGSSRSQYICLSAHSICCVSVLPVHIAPCLYKECVNLVAETSKKKNCRHRPSPRVVFDEFLMLVMFYMRLMRLNLFSFALKCPPMKCPPIHLCYLNNFLWSLSALFHTLVLRSIQEFQCSFVFPSNARRSISSVSIHCCKRSMLNEFAHFVWRCWQQCLQQNQRKVSLSFSQSLSVNRPEDTIAPNKHLKDSQAPVTNVLTTNFQFFWISGFTHVKMQPTQWI